MLTFSSDPDVAEQQMNAIIFYLTAFGYIDGDFDRSEKTFVRIYIRELVETRAKDLMPNEPDDVRADVVKKFVSHFHEVFEQIDRDIQELFTEMVAHDENVEEFVLAKLKLRSYEIFRSFDKLNQQALLETIDELIHADGKVHESEIKFRDELRELLDSEFKDELSEMLDIGIPSREIEITGAEEKEVRTENHAFFKPVEEHYSSDPVRMRQQAEADHSLLVRTMAMFDEQREAGNGKLNGKADVHAFDGEKPFLDGHVYVHPLQPNTNYELTVLGDLHGCYSCLKAALMQSDFFAKVEAYRLDPRNNPNPKLVFLGDYIDRGHFSYNGVLRTVMQLFLTAPDHVFILRGNHEYYIEYKGKIYGGVKPAEAINTLINHMPKEMFESYMKLFEAMPNFLLFDRTLFVHAGIPRDATMKEKWKDLSSLNDPEIRFQMLWSDPSQADHIPDELQAQNARFPFGRKQYERFIKGIGCHTMVRGHEKIVEGFASIYPDDMPALLNLFSAGGADNNDLPANSSYRGVTPMALTMSFIDGQPKATPWKINWEMFNDPDRNAFFQSPPEIDHKAG